MADSDSIDAGLLTFLGYRFKRVNDAIGADLRSQLEPLGLRISTFSVLVLISTNAGIRQSALASTLNIKRSNMVAIVEELENNGWIVRNQVPTDRRAMALDVTAAGKKLCDVALKAGVKHELQLFDCLSQEELKQLSAMLEKIELAKGSV